ncbi:MAG: aldo/keto reductase [Rhizobacter sp.]|nr:aldo/keto reductase [Rhizobacter sp.]
MNTRLLGRTVGPPISCIGLGCNNFGQRLNPDQATSVIEAALDAGVNFFDTADVYAGGESERILGGVLTTCRHEAVIATKFGYVTPTGFGPGSRANVLASVEASLRRLRTDYIDLYQLHRPDETTPWEETLQALQDVVKAGKVRYVGASNLSAAQIEQARRIAEQLGVDHFVTQQNEYSLLRRSVETSVLPATLQQGAGFLPYFPLANGMLSGKYRSGEPMPEAARLSSPGKWQNLYVTNADLSTTARLRVWAEERGHSLLELAFAWLLSSDAVVSVIAGATSAPQIRQNAQASNWQLTAAELLEIDVLAPRIA